MRIDSGCARCCAIVLLLALSPSSVEARERSKTCAGFEIRLTLAGGALYQAIEADKYPTVRLPDYMKNERRNSPLATIYPTLTTDFLTDNPLVHGASFAHLAFEAENAGFTLFCKLIAEHRGASYGVYSMKNVAVVPELSASMDTSFTIGGERFRIGAGAGNFDNYRLYEGLAIYNIDVQGRQIYLQWRRCKAAFSSIGDLERGIGLDIGDQHDYTISLEKLAPWKQLTLNASAGYFRYERVRVPGDGLLDNGWNASISLNWKETLRLYSQVGIRNADDDRCGRIERCADLVGCELKSAASKFEFGLTGEYRYYGRYFNEGFHYDEDCFLYRGFEPASNDCSSWNSIGEYLYPLDLYYRPFSQWAVYTDYEGRDVQTFICRADASCKLPAGCELFCNLDFNYMDVSNEEPFLYPFYNAGFGWSPAPGMTVGVSRTNRGMNLDKHYPTLYLLEHGLFMFSFQGAIAF